MNLVEILARDLEQWRGVWLFCAQSIDGQIYFDNEERYQSNFERGEFFEIADDWTTARITRAQWEAERARIAAMEGISAFSQEQEISESQREKIAKEWWDKQMQGQPLMVMDIPSTITKNYEQELWDKAALAATQAFITGHITHFGHENVWQDTELVSCAADCADAFMAERAKRLKR